ncbi:MAG TPA: restriction endonuclease subunit S, partial [Spirochaetia bacterium]|nr:restriction endonuclease subunit S [Spirochaetia bacterium]
MNDDKPRLTPKLRFPEFRDAEGWTGMRMSEVYSFKGNNSFSRDQLNYNQGIVKNIHYGDIHTKFSTLFDVTCETVPFINPTESLDGFRPDNDCVEGDIVFADASEDMDDIGKSIEIVRLNGERVVAGQHTILARPNDDILVIGFGAYLFKSKHIRTQIQKESQGAKVLGLSASRLTKIILPIPRSKAEQHKIAACLSSLDDLIDAETRKLDALKAHKKGLLRNLFPREGETRP